MQYKVIYKADNTIAGIGPDDKHYDHPIPAGGRLEYMTDTEAIAVWQAQESAKPVVKSLEERVAALEVKGA